MFYHGPESLGQPARNPNGVPKLMPGKRNEKELRLLFFQFMSVLVHYNWTAQMMGDPSSLIGGEEAFVRQLVRTYSAAFQALPGH